MGREVLSATQTEALSRAVQEARAAQTASQDRKRFRHVSEYTRREQIGREDSLKWLTWLKELSGWMQGAYQSGQEKLDQTWESYAEYIPHVHDLSLNAAEKGKFDDRLTELFLAHPVLLRANKAIDAMKEGRVSDKRASSIQSLMTELNDLKDHLGSLEKASLRGSLPEAEREIVRLQRLLWQEQRFDKEVRSAEQAAEDERRTLTSREREAVLSRAKHVRRFNEQSAIVARRERDMAKDQMYLRGNALRDTLLASGVQPSEIARYSMAISSGDFSVLDEVSSFTKRFTEGKRVGGWLRGLKDVLRPQESVLTERAQAFRQACKNLEIWQTRVEEYQVDEQRALRAA